MFKNADLQLGIAIASTSIIFFGSLVLFGNYFLAALFITGGLFLILFLVCNSLYG
jgi:hypothetical protein